MLVMTRAASLTVIWLALTQTAFAQGGRQEAAGSSLAGLVFPSPPPATVKDGFTYAVLGDISQVGPVTQPPAPSFEKVLAVVRRADFALANQEGTAFDYRSMPWITGSGMFPMDSGSPRDIKLMGVDMVTLANNHGGDYGTEALMENMRLIRAAGLAYVGAGKNLREARAASLVATPKGRVTVVAAAGTFKDGFAAVDGRRGGDPEKPGVSTVRTTIVQQVTGPEMRLLQQLDATRRQGSAAEDTTLPRQITVLGQTYQLGNAPGLSYRINPVDLREIMEAVHTAKQSSDFTIFTIHAHQSATGGDDINPVPADYLVQLFHSVVDAGADVVAGHGNHLLRGIEIYKGKPIFYGIASFSFSGRSGGVGNAGRGGQPAAPAAAPQQPRASEATPSVGPGQGPRPPNQPSNEYLRPLPNGEVLSMWESMFATTEWEAGKLKEIRVYPIDLNASGGKPKGVPEFASPAVAKKILEEMQRYSLAFGTKMQIEGEVGIIRP
jgi:poly-gamma-glutamate capsule biosynthesis protein CapA/YwtB (metallophosphatase superfamily)